MRIAICDDNPADARHVKELMEQFLHAHQYAAEIHLFLHPDELLATMEHTRFSLYLLDILMPMVNGIEAGRSIRLLDRTTQIIYVTGEARFALESFDTNPTTYLLKPVDAPKLFATLERIFPRLSAEETRVITVKSSKGLRVLHFSEILCCEYRAHKLHFTLFSDAKLESKYLSQSFSEYIAPLMETGEFVKTHESFIINLGYLTHLSPTTATLKGELKVPVSRNHYAAVRDAYLTSRLGTGTRD